MNTWGITMDGGPALSAASGIEYPDRLAVVVDPTTGATMIDVSDWVEPIDRAALARIGDPVLVCFGQHEEKGCALGGVGEWHGEHGVVFEVAGDGKRKADLLRSLRRLVRFDCPIRVRPRAAT